MMTVETFFKIIYITVTLLMIVSCLVCTVTCGKCGQCWGLSCSACWKLECTKPERADIVPLDVTNIDMGIALSLTNIEMDNVIEIYEKSSSHSLDELIRL